MSIIFFFANVQKSLYNSQYYNLLSISLNLFNISRTTNLRYKFKNAKTSILKKHDIFLALACKIKQRIGLLPCGPQAEYFP